MFESPGLATHGRNDLRTSDASHGLTQGQCPSTIRQLPGQTGVATATPCTHLLLMTAGTMRAGDGIGGRLRRYRQGAG